MAETEPRPFVIGEQDAMVRLNRVAMHRVFEADKSGKTAIHVWMAAEIAPAAEAFESIKASVEFVLYNEDRQLGTCNCRDLAFTDPDDTREIKADDELRIPSHEDVTHVEVHIEASKVIRRTAQLKLHPA